MADGGVVVTQGVANVANHGAQNIVNHGVQHLLTQDVTHAVAQPVTQIVSEGAPAGHGNLNQHAAPPQRYSNAYQLYPPIPNGASSGSILR